MPCNRTPPEPWNLGLESWPGILAWNFGLKSGPEILAGADLPPPRQARISLPPGGGGSGRGGSPAGRPVGHLGYHRRVLYLDVVSDKERIDAERGKSLNALAEQAQALKMG